MKRLLIPLLTLALSAVSGAALAGNVQHAMGRTTTPDNPQRIVVLTTEGTEAVLALGIKPVGAANGRAVNARGSVWYAHVADWLDGVEPLGEERAVNLEQIAALEPDLILGNRQRHEGVYDQLSAIAPTVLSNRLRGDWRKNFELYAEALGKKDEGAAVLAAFDKRVAELSDALGAQKDETLSVIRFMPGQIRIYQRDSFSGDVLARLGAQEGKTVVVVLHDLNLAARFADDIVFFRAGQVAGCGPVEAVFHQELIEDVFGIECIVRREEASGRPFCVPLAACPARRDRLVQD